jgi:hypothetical protein
MCLCRGKAGNSSNWKHVYILIVLPHFTLPAICIKKIEGEEEKRKTAVQF